MWYYRPLLPWGTILAIHYVFVKGIPGTNILTKEWEEEEYEKQLERLRGDRFSYLEEEEEEFIPQKGKYLAYTELSDEEALELRRLQKHSSSLGQDFV